MHLVLCDAIDTGKSTFVLEAARRLAGRGIRISGWITPAHMKDGEKRGHDCIAIDRGAIEAPIPFTRLEPFEGSLPFMKYHFNAKAFDRVNAIAPAAELFVMDEIGPLELIEHRGFHDAMLAAFASAPATLAVVRTGLGQALRQALPGHTLRVLTLDAARREESLLFRAVSSYTGTP